MSEQVGIVRTASISPFDGIADLLLLNDGRDSGPRAILRMPLVLRECSRNAPAGGEAPIDRSSPTAVAPANVRHRNIAPVAILSRASIFVLAACVGRYSRLSTRKRSIPLGLTPRSIGRMHSMGGAAFMRQALTARNDGSATCTSSVRYADMRLVTRTGKAQWRSMRYLVPPVCGKVERHDAMYEW